MDALKDRPASGGCRAIDTFMFSLNEDNTDLLCTGLALPSTSWVYYYVAGYAANLRCAMRGRCQQLWGRRRKLDDSLVP